jgi:hypothetical protein
MLEHLAEITAIDSSRRGPGQRMKLLSASLLGGSPTIRHPTDCATGNFLDIRERLLREEVLFGYLQTPDLE